MSEGDPVEAAEEEATKEIIEEYAKHESSLDVKKWLEGTNVKDGHLVREGVPVK